MLLEKIENIKLLLTDCDGVLTDGCVYYSVEGEALKKFSFRDGMGAERLRKNTEIDIGIITGENSEIVRRRAEKLKISELHLGIKNKLKTLHEIMERKQLDYQHIAYIGDDMNDLCIIEKVGLTACPQDAFKTIKKYVDYVCEIKGGQGAFREFCEVIIQGKNTFEDE